MGWTATRGGHSLFTADLERWLKMLAEADAVEGKGYDSGKFTLPSLPDLEFRVGGYHANGSVKQFQSVVPPTAGREWNGVDTVAELPESAYATLERIAKRIAITTANQADQEANHVGVVPSGIGSKRSDAKLEARVLAFLKKAKPAIDGEGGSNVAFRVACDVVRFGIENPETIVRLLRDWNERCEPPWSRAELLHKATEACKEEQRRDRVQGRGKPPPPSENGHQTFSNFDEEWRVKDDGERENKKHPRRIDAIAEHLQTFKRGWPKRVDEALFIQTPDYRPVYLNSSARVFAWIDRSALVDWTKGARFVTQERFYEHLRMTAEQFDAIETLPHWPPIPGIHYMYKPLPEQGGLLEKLIDRFKPATTIDKALIKALILTLFWGGSPGQRPAFLITGPDGDDDQGRAVGKSKLCHILSDELADGYVGVLPTDAIADVKTRLLSTEQGRKRVVLLDNVKTLRLSWADLEGMITESTISGRRLFVGEGRRPNILIWLITLNGATFSKDMAQRSIQIKLARPEAKSGWEDEIRQFCRDHRPEILSDIRRLLLMKPNPLVPTSRWATWERDIVSKLADCSAIQEEIKARQRAIDDDSDEKALIIEHFRKKLTDHGHDPDHDAVLIPSSVLAEWVSEATRISYPTNRASAFVKSLQIANMRKSDRDGRRIWMWVGKEAKADDARPLVPNPTEARETPAPGSGGSDGGSGRKPGTAFQKPAF